MYNCNLCSSPSFEIAVNALKTVTSDCRPWPSLTDIYICNNCGHVQKPYSEIRQQELNKIYNNYQLHSISQAIDQPLFEQGVSYPRSLKVIQSIKKHIDLPDKGSLLDIGCGRGALLSAFSKEFQNWKLFGQDIDHKYQSDILKIHGVKDYFWCPIKDIDITFDIITLNDVIEHIESPIAFLLSLKKLLKNNGSIVIAVPNFFENPFDLTIYDHCSHFTSHAFFLPQI